MKKFAILATMLLLALLAATTSCKKESSDPQDEPPAISLFTGTGYVSSNTSVVVNSPLKFGIRASQNANTGAKLTGFTLKRNFNGNTQSYDTTFSVASFNVDLTTVAYSQAGNETMTFTIRDEKGATAEKSLVVTTTIPPAK